MGDVESLEQTVQQSLGEERRERGKKGGSEDAVGVTLCRCVVCASMCVSSGPCRISERKHLVLAAGEFVEI